MFPLRLWEGMNPVYSVYVGVFNQILWTFGCSARLIKDCCDNRCFICRRRIHHDRSFCLTGEFRELFDWQQETCNSARKLVLTWPSASFPFGLWLHARIHLRCLNGIRSKQRRPLLPSRPVHRVVTPLLFKHGRTLMCTAAFARLLL